MNELGIDLVVVFLVVLALAGMFLGNWFFVATAVGGFFVLVLPDLNVKELLRRK